MPQPANPLNPNPIYTRPCIQLPITGVSSDYGFYNSPEFREAYDKYKSRISKEIEESIEKQRKEQEEAQKLKDEQEKNKRYEQFLKLKQEFENSDND